MIGSRCKLAKPRFYLMLLAAFAGTGLVLAATGIYGVISYTVARRTREFGVRIALGAEHRDILQLVLAQGTRLTVLGAVLGLAGVLYFFGALVLSTALVQVCLWASSEKTNVRAKWLMHATILHIPILFGLMAYDKIAR